MNDWIVDVTILSYYINYTISSFTSNTESFFNHKMSAKKSHIVEAPVSENAKDGIKAINSGRVEVDLSYKQVF